MLTPSTSRYRIGIDTGGTFTDVVAVNEDTGAVHSTKTPSTPNDPSRALHMYQTALAYDPHQPELVTRVKRLRSRGVRLPRQES